jgi:CheY-like chemotaxis protein
MSKRILVVEDQPDNRQIIRDMLAASDYQITEAENGEEALTANQGRRFAALNPDHRSHVICAQRRRTEGASGRLR